MAAIKMSDKEYREFKEKSGHREPQKVKTFYKEAAREKEGISHHRERAAQNRDVVSLPGRMERRVTGSTRFTTAARQTGGEVRKKAGRVKERVAAPARVVSRAARPFVQDFGTMFGPSPRGHAIVPDMGFAPMMPNYNPAQMQMGAYGPSVPRMHPPGKKGRKGARKEPGAFYWEEMGGIPDDVKRWM